MHIVPKGGKEKILNLSSKCNNSEISFQQILISQLNFELFPPPMTMSHIVITNDQFQDKISHITEVKWVVNMFFFFYYWFAPRKLLLL